MEKDDQKRSGLSLACLSPVACYDGNPKYWTALAKMFHLFSTIFNKKLRKSETKAAICPGLFKILQERILLQKNEVEVLEKFKFCANSCMCQYCRGPFFITFLL